MWKGRGVLATRAEAVGNTLLNDLIGYRQLKDTDPEAAIERIVHAGQGSSGCFSELRVRQTSGSLVLLPGPQRPGSRSALWVCRKTQVTSLPDGFQPTH